MTVRHVFVDESMRDRYLLVATPVGAHDLARRRRGIRDLVAPGQHRVHMVKESAPRRRLVLQRLVDLSLTSTVYEAGRQHRSNLARRRACLERLVEDSLAAGPVRLHLESATGVDQHDRQQMIELARRLDDRDALAYQHEHARAEPLLSAPDAIAWAWSRGGEWRIRARPLVDAVVAV